MYAYSNKDAINTSFLMSNLNETTEVCENIAKVNDSNIYVLELLDINLTIYIISNDNDLNLLKSIIANINTININVPRLEYFIDNYLKTIQLDIMYYFA